MGSSPGSRPRRRPALRHPSGRSCRPPGPSPPAGRLPRDPGAIAQLGERRAGSAKVVGSSPTSSTPRMDDPDGYFGERVAARYDEPRRARCSSPPSIDPVVDLLAELARGGRALELGDRHGPDRAAAGRARRRGARDRAVAGDGRAAAREARRRARSASRSATSRPTRVDGHVRARLPGLQHDRQPDDPGGAGRVLPNVAAHLEPGGCFVIEVGVPDLQRLPAGRDHAACFDVARAPLGHRRVRRREPGPDLAPLLAGRRTARAQLGPVPLRLAGRARPDGAARRDDAARPLERLEARAVHQREPQARVGLGEAGIADDRGG